MKEKYVTSLELSKRLKELGFKQESDFYWVGHKGGAYNLMFQTEQRGWRNENCGGFDQLPVMEEAISAYHVGELGEMLPLEVRIERKIGVLSGKIGWFIENAETRHIIKERTEADARAKMLIYLAENNLIEPTKL